MSMWVVLTASTICAILYLHLHWSDVFNHYIASHSLLAFHHVRDFSGSIKKKINYIHTNTLFCNEYYFNIELIIQEFCVYMLNKSQSHYLGLLLV